MWANRIERSGVFETNSSSTHSVTIANGLLTDRIIFHGKTLTVTTDNFNNDDTVITGAATKASYALTQLKNYDSYGEEDHQRMSDNWELMLKDVLVKHTGAKQIVFEGCPALYGTDHGWGSVSSMNVDMFESLDTLEQFIFNSNSYVETSYNG